MLDTLDRSNVVADVAAAMAYLRTDLSEAEGIDRISMLGFSVGGHIAYLAATQLDLAGTAVLYGGWLASTAIGLSRPEPTLSLTPGIAEHGGTILYLVGNEDAVISATDRAAIIEALTEAGVPHELVSYPDTAHAFFWEGADSFNAAARDDAWQRVLAFL